MSNSIKNNRNSSRELLPPVPGSSSQLSPSKSSSSLSPSLSDKKQNAHSPVAKTMSSTGSVSTKSSLKSSIMGHTQSSSSREMMESIMKRLTLGSMLLKFYSKGKPEKRFFKMIRENHQLKWYNMINGKHVEESCLDLREIREIRMGTCSRIFEKWQEDAKKWKNEQSFVVLYGSSFRLKTLSCVGGYFSCVFC